MLDIELPAFGASLMSVHSDSRRAGQRVLPSVAFEGAGVLALREGRLLRPGLFAVLIWAMRVCLATSLAMAERYLVSAFLCFLSASLTFSRQTLNVTAVLASV